MSINYIDADPAGPTPLQSEGEKDRAALAAALAAADRLAKLASTIPLVNRTLDDHRTEQ